MIEYEPGKGGGECVAFQGELVAKCDKQHRDTESIQRDLERANLSTKKAKVNEKDESGKKRRSGPVVK